MKYGKGIFQDGIEEILDRDFVPRPDPIFYEIESMAKAKILPIVSPATGKALAGLVSLFQPKSLLEFGTNIGYSLLWMVQGLQKASTSTDPIRILSIDRNPYEQSLGEGHVRPFVPPSWDLQFQSYWILDGLEKGLVHPSEFEFVFVDCDKVSYPKLFSYFLQACVDRKNQKCLWVFDNVLWKGRILEKENLKPSDLAVLEFWDMVKQSKIDYCLLPVGDGLLLLQP